MLGDGSTDDPQHQQDSQVADKTRLLPKSTDNGKQACRAGKGRDSRAKNRQKDRNLAPKNIKNRKWREGFDITTATLSQRRLPVLKGLRGSQGHHKHHQP
jgi:hypothetical protein